MRLSYESISTSSAAATSAAATTAATSAAVSTTSVGTTAIIITIATIVMIVTTMVIVAVVCSIYVPMNSEVDISIPMIFNNILMRRRVIVRFVVSVTICAVTIVRDSSHTVIYVIRVFIGFPLLLDRTWLLSFKSGRTSVSLVLL